MASADDDNFDIDIYGDGDGDDQTAENQPSGASTATAKDEGDELVIDIGEAATDPDASSNRLKSDGGGEVEDSKMANGTDYHPATSRTDDGTSETNMPKQPPQKQGIKRKGGEDDRPLEPGATNAITVSDLHWWSTDDDIRGWLNQAECEDELKEITFSEHKVNGKSKGYSPPSPRTHTHAHHSPAR